MMPLFSLPPFPQEMNLLPQILLPRILQELLGCPVGHCPHCGRAMFTVVFPKLIPVGETVLAGAHLRYSRTPWGNQPPRPSPLLPSPSRSPSPSPQSASCPHKSTPLYNGAVLSHPSSCHALQVWLGDGDSFAYASCSLFFPPASQVSHTEKLCVSSRSGSNTSPLY